MTPPPDAYAGTRVDLKREKKGCGSGSFLL